MIAQQYESQKVLSATPMELILMLYDGGLRSLSRALDAFDDIDEINRMNRVHVQLLEAQSYVTELACSLDVERGGEMAVQLEALYDFMLQHLIDANTKMQRDPVENVQRMLGELREGWIQAMNSMPREQQQPEAVPVERASSFNFSG